MMFLHGNSYSGTSDGVGFSAQNRIGLQNQVDHSLIQSKSFGVPDAHSYPSTLTASQSGGWVPETSRINFNYWQPAPRWRLLPWLANPGNPAMSPQLEGEKQAPVTLIKQWKEREG